MSPLYPYTIVPVLSVSLLLFFTALRRGRAILGLALYSGTIALWCGALLLTVLPSTAAFGQRTLTSGSFICASYLHTAWAATGQRRYHLVWFAYAVAVVTTIAGALFPEQLHQPGTLAAGPLFWHTFAASVVAVSFPLGYLALAWRRARGPARRELALLLGCGLMGTTGAWLNGALIARGLFLPHGMLLVLASLLLLAHLIRAHEPPHQRRLLDRSILYSALASFLSVGFLFGVMTLGRAEPLLGQYRLGALLLLFLAALAFEPLRQQLQELIGRRLLPHRVSAEDLARALAAEEARADQAQRLAELGAFASAVAHEVRNPLGVLSAHLRLLERRDVEPETLAAMRGEIRRAERFIEDLLRYGRPRPLELRMLDLGATFELALGTARDGLGEPLPDLEVERALDPAASLVEADQAQLSQALVILIDNALLALASAPTRRLRLASLAQDGRVLLRVEDSGPGIPPELAERLFQPFVTGRKRGQQRSGTGLGLAIARGIVERHGGAIRAGRSKLGGARLEIELPRYQHVLGAAPSAPEK